MDRHFMPWQSALQTILPRHRLPLTDLRHATAWWNELQEAPLSESFWHWSHIKSTLCQSSNFRLHEKAWNGLQSCIALQVSQQYLCSQWKKHFGLKRPLIHFQLPDRQQPPTALSLADSLDKNFPSILSISLFGFLAATYHHLHWSHWKYLQILNVASLWLLCGLCLARRHCPGFPLAALALLAVLLWCGMIATDQSRLYLDTGAIKCTLPAWPCRDTEWQGQNERDNVTTIQVTEEYCFDNFKPKSPKSEGFKCHTMHPPASVSACLECWLVSTVGSPEKLRFPLTEYDGSTCLFSLEISPQHLLIYRNCFSHCYPFI